MHTIGNLDSTQGPSWATCFVEFFWNFCCFYAVAKVLCMVFKSLWKH